MRIYFDTGASRAAEIRWQSDSPSPEYQSKSEPTRETRHEKKLFSIFLAAQCCSTIPISAGRDLGHSAGQRSVDFRRVFI